MATVNAVILHMVRGGSRCAVGSLLAGCNAEKNQERKNMAPDIIVSIEHLSHRQLELRAAGVLRSGLRLLVSGGG